MKQRLINSQLSNFKTYLMYRRQLVSIAQNVFVFKNLSEFINKEYMNRNLLYNNGVAFFKEDVLDEVVCLPFRNVILETTQGDPVKIEVYGKNGYHRMLTNIDPKNPQFVVMRDNNAGYSLLLDIVQYAERIANCERTIDINIVQQRTPRIWKTSEDKKKTLTDLVNEIDGNCEKVMTYDDINIDDTTCIMEPAPFVADKVDQIKDKIYNEFLRLVGIANLSYQKKERNIRDEIMAMQGGTIASRFSRFEPRKDAVEKINKLWGTNIEVEYYDGEPSTEKEVNKSDEESDNYVDDELSNN